MLSKGTVIIYQRGGDRRHRRGGSKILPSKREGEPKSSEFQGTCKMFDMNPVIPNKIHFF